MQFRGDLVSVGNESNPFSTIDGNAVSQSRFTVFLDTGDVCGGLSPSLHSQFRQE